MELAARSAERRADERCPFCHDALLGAVVRCPGCRKPHHEACAEEAGRGAVHGCGRQLAGHAPGGGW